MSNYQLVTSHKLKWRSVLGAAGSALTCVGMSVPAKFEATGVYPSNSCDVETDSWLGKHDLSSMESCRGARGVGVGSAFCVGKDWHPQES